MPDPLPIDAATWSAIDQWLLTMGLYIVCIATFGFSMLVGAAIIPSLVSTGHLPAKFLRLRPLIIGFGMMGLLAAVIFMSWSILQLREVDNFWENWWI